MENIYHVLYRKPALEKWEMTPEQEELAVHLVESGRFRIDANEKVNFVRFSYPSEGINIVFSYRELCDAELIPRTEEIIKKLLSRKYKGSSLSSQTKKTMERLRHDVTKIVGVDAKTEMKLARAIVQAAHPAVIALLLLEGAELFLSYSHTVGDMLDICSWQEVGSSSGLQTTGYRESSVLVSAGGNPFTPEDKKEYEGDGFNALARMIVIGGQELGHFSDIKRDRRGRKVGRYSADLGASRATEEVRLGRLKDIENTKNIGDKLDKFRLREIAEFERHLKFFKKQKRRGMIVISTKRKVNNISRGFLRKCRRAKFNFAINLPRDMDGHFATPIAMMVDDMKFNLAPKADAYMREDPVEEEAIACIEALARVPQQVNKWGHAATKAMMPNLYRIYYGEVIPGCIEACERMLGKKFDSRLTRKSSVRSLWERVFYRGV